MKRIPVLLLALALFVAANQNPQEKYIRKYSATAVSEMKRTGVPASITMAQGIVESRSGESPLAKKANNHFGIKCHNDWTGKTFTQDDDMKQECFRVYGSAEESFRAHSDFLCSRERYQALFKLDPKDYKAWARGLKDAGYATDPSYASKLIKVIEDYKLYELDGSAPAETVKEPEAVAAPEKAAEAAAPATGVKEQLGFPLSRVAMTANGVPFLIALEGEDYESISYSREMRLKDILRYNDLEINGTLIPGTVVYLQPKAVRAPRGTEPYVVENDDETLREVSQRFALKLRPLARRNKLSPRARLRKGDTIIL